MSTPNKGQEPENTGITPMVPGPAGGNVFPSASGLRPLRLFVLAVVVLIGGGVALYLMFSGPRMRVGPKLVPYQVRLLAMPTAAVPVVPAEGQAPALAPSPPADMERTRRAGEAYYTNYCLCCHGKEGRGDGPVGRSYMPAPTDLTSPAVQALPDETLYRSMLTGVGHAPVLSYAVDPEAPRYIVAYVRSLPAKE
jgi:mono/diheme cytochrome c family protein